MLGEDVRKTMRRLGVCSLFYLLWLGAPLEMCLAQDIDDVIAAAAESGTFAGVVLVRYQDGSEVFRSVGDAVREFGVPHQRDTRFKFHSLTKPLTSVALYSAIADGFIDDEASICRYLEPCPAEWQPVQVGQLLNHSSGLPELENDWFSGWQGDLRSTYQALLDERSDFSLVADPGTTFRYSNGGYALLSLVLEAATGQPIHSVMASRVFEPAGMTDAEMERAPDRSVDGWYNGPVLTYRLAAGYNGSPSEVRTAYSLMYTIPGAGGAIGTADDLVHFARAVLRDGLLPDGLSEKMLTPDPVVHERYADGWIVGERQGHLRYSHTGGTNGFLSSLDYYPDLDLTIVILSNLGFTDLGGLSGSIANIALQSATELEAR
jgi:CubicO group peptidase (beta-lactamase class C family)